MELESDFHVNILCHDAEMTFLRVPQRKLKAELTWPEKTHQLLYCMFARPDHRS